MIAVTGATGNLGQFVIKQLIKQESPMSVVALVRNPAKAEGLRALGIRVREADYEKTASWLPALVNVRSLLLISSSELGKREAQHQTVITAAKAAGIKHIVYTSVLKADKSALLLAKEHLATEKAIKASGLAHTILRNGWYLENHTGTMASAIQHGAVHGAAKTGRFSSATREEYAAAAVNVLTGVGHVNKTYELAGDTAFTLAEFAAELTKLSGKTVRYQDHSYEQYKNMLVGVGLPSTIATMLADSDAGASKAWLQDDSRTLSRLIGRPTTPLSAALTIAVKKLKG